MGFEPTDRVNGQRFSSPRALGGSPAIDAVHRTRRLGRLNLLRGGLKAMSSLGDAMMRCDPRLDDVRDQVALVHQECYYQIA